MAAVRVVRSVGGRVEVSGVLFAVDDEREEYGGQTVKLFLVSIGRHLSWNVSVYTVQKKKKKKKKKKGGFDHTRMNSHFWAPEFLQLRHAWPSGFSPLHLIFLFRHLLH